MVWWGIIWCASVLPSSYHLLLLSLSSGTFQHTFWAMYSWLTSSQIFKTVKKFSAYCFWNPSGLWHTLYSFTSCSSENSSASMSKKDQCRSQIRWRTSLTLRTILSSLYKNSKRTCLRVKRCLNLQERKCSMCPTETHPTYSGVIVRARSSLDRTWWELNMKKKVAPSTKVSCYYLGSYHSTMPGTLRWTHRRLDGKWIDYASILMSHCGQVQPVRKVTWCLWKISSA